VGVEKLEEEGERILIAWFKGIPRPLKGIPRPPASIHIYSYYLLAVCTVCKGSGLNPE